MVGPTLLAKRELSLSTPSTTSALPFKRRSFPSDIPSPPSLYTFPPLHLHPFVRFPLPFLTFIVLPRSCALLLACEFTFGPLKFSNRQPLRFIPLASCQSPCPALLRASTLFLASRSKAVSFRSEKFLAVFFERSSSTERAFSFDVCVSETL